MPQNLADYLRRSAIRMKRTNWSGDGGTRLLSEEFYTILANIVPDTTGPISITPPGGGDPTTFPPIDDLNIPPFDLDLPEDGVNQPEVPETSPTYTRTETIFWHRAVFPGQIKSQVDGATYKVTVHPNGSLITFREAGFGAPTRAATKDVEARVTDESLAGTISNNAWVYVFWIVEYALVEEVFRDDDGRETGRQSELKILQQEYLFNGPPSSSAGKVARVTETITARDGLTPGKGRAILYDFNPGGEVDPITGEIANPSLVDGTAVDVYSSVSSEIPAGEDGIQVKRIDNAWFIDVQDCGASEEEGDVSE